MSQGAAMVKDSVVINVIVVDLAGIKSLEAALQKDGDCDYLIVVGDEVQIGDTYDEEKSVFLRDGVRVYPQKTDSERIAELETQISEIQDALIEVAGIVAMSDSGEDGGTDG